MSLRYIPYSTQSITADDIDKVVSVLKSDWLTGGKSITDFEDGFSAYCGSRFSIAVNSGTAALHSAVNALNLEENDEVIVPAISFVATANAVVYEKCTPVFCDVDENTLLIDTSYIADLVTPKTKALIAVDYAGQLADYATLVPLCRRHNLTLIADACHSLGAETDNVKSGNLADMTTFSFHPVKQITTGEGGMITTNSERLSRLMRAFRNHHMSSTPAQRQHNIHHDYDVNGLGYNYRLTDFQAALGLSQLHRLASIVEKRRRLAAQYTTAFADHTHIAPLDFGFAGRHAYHLYVVKVPNRDVVFTAMRKRGIGVNVHYKPIYLHKAYREMFNTKAGLCPTAEKVYENILSLPLYPGLSSADQRCVIDNLIDIVNSL